MSNNLYIYEKDMPSVRLTEESMAGMKKICPDIDYRFMQLYDVTPEDIDACDNVFFIRPDNAYSWRIASAARKAGHVAEVFMDDDLLNLPKGSPILPWQKRGLIKAIKNSDILGSSSRYIAEKYRSMTASGRIVSSDTVVGPEETEGIDIAHEGNDRVKIVYAAGPAHSGLFEKYIGPVVPRLLEKYGSSISFTFVSVHPRFDGECEYVPGMALDAYRKHMKDAHYDIGLAPLDSDEFSKCKYFNKFLEYTTQGIAGIYSDTEPYTYVVKDGENGFLAGPSPEDWYEAICRAVDDKKLRQQCVANAIEYVRTNHTAEAVVNQAVTAVPEMVKPGGPYAKCGNFTKALRLYRLLKPVDWACLAVYYLRHTGIKGLSEMIRARSK
ncbi:MAG: glycosyltransferase [Firmicutes bacterium]|nr:glycosyltransferase [Bacillota bacterium]